MIFIGSAATLLAQQTQTRSTIVITDSNVARLYPHIINEYPHIVMGTGEGIKTLKTVGEICAKLLEMQADRGVLLVGMGGGIVTDVVGFVASTYMRGVDFGFVSTTLVGQVDASIGGKNGVNLDGYKNIVGTFNLPKFIIADPAMLDTLPEEEFQAAMGEVIKYALIEDPSILELSDNKTIIERCMQIKQRIVESDFRESGERKMLNLGHTFGHAIEKAFPERYLHGQAVAIGICIAAEISVRLGFLPRAVFEQIETQLSSRGLPTKCEDTSIEELSTLVLADKKRKGSTVEMILLRGIGQAFIHPIKIENGRLAL